jgi:hypothetical protein
VFVENPEVESEQRDQRCGRDLIRGQLADAILLRELADGPVGDPENRAADPSG